MKSEIESYLEGLGGDAREASISISTATLEQKSKCLRSIAEDLHKNRSSIKEKNLEDINKLLSSGADKVSINTAAVLNKNLIEESSKKFGSQCIVVAVDAKKVKDNKWEIFTHGGRKSTGKEEIKFINGIPNNLLGYLYPSSKKPEKKVKTGLSGVVRCVRLSKL